MHSRNSGYVGVLFATFLALIWMIWSGLTVMLPDNTDQGSQFTSIAFTQILKDAKIAISMPLGDCMQSPAGNRWSRRMRDNVFVERLWRTIKYEEVYLHAYNTVPEARTAIGKYINFYNTKRPHSSLDGLTPDQAYFNAQQPVPVAA